MENSKPEGSIKRKQMQVGELVNRRRLGEDIKLGREAEREEE